MQTVPEPHNPVAAVPSHLMPSQAGRDAVALDVGAGDGSLCSPYAHLFRTVAVTELTAPLCWRLKATETKGAKLETYATAELTPRHLGERNTTSPLGSITRSTYQR